MFSPSWVSKYLARPLHNSAEACSAELERLALRMVQEKRRKLRDDPESQHSDLAALMIDSGSMTDYEIASQLVTYMVAG